VRLKPIDMVILIRKVLCVCVFFFIRNKLITSSLYHEISSRLEENKAMWMVPRCVLKRRLKIYRNRYIMIYYDLFSWVVNNTILRVPYTVIPFIRHLFLVYMFQSACDSWWLVNLNRKFNMPVCRPFLQKKKFPTRFLMIGLPE